MDKQYIFGPVVSRRLGRSLGIDLIREHRCSLDCIYCEAGSTRELTTERCSNVDINEVKKQLSDFLATKPQLDYITFSGLGEPTLHLHLAEFCCWLKNTYPQYRIALLTNGTLLNDPAVRAALKFVDLCMPNFDASNDRELAVINRPAPGITVQSLAEGIRAACMEHPDKLILELFVVPGVNDSDESIESFAGYIKSFKHLKSVQLNTLDRPGVVDWIKPADRKTLERFMEAICKIVPVETIGRYRCCRRQENCPTELEEVEKSLLELLNLNALTAGSLAEKLSITESDAAFYAEKLLQLGKVCAEKIDRQTFYSKLYNA